MEKSCLKPFGLPTSLWPAGKPQLQVLHLQDRKFRPNKSSHLRPSYANLAHPKESNHSCAVAGTDDLLHRAVVSVVHMVHRNCGGIDPLADRANSATRAAFL